MDNHLKKLIPSKEYLECYQLVDSSSEKAFDQITELAATICGTPISLVTILDDERQFFKSHYGMDINETPIDHAFCIYALERPDQPMIVSDARLDARFQDNPYVKSNPGIVFYAGFPLVTQDGIALGSLCVLDMEIRELSEDKVRALEILSHQVVQLLELRRSNLENQAILGHLQNEKEFNRKLVENIDGVFWVANAKNLEFTYLSPQLERIMGYSAEEWKASPTFWVDHIHPEDRERVITACKKAVQNLEDHQFDYRFMTKSGDYLWINDRVVVYSEDGKPVQLTGLFLDISDQVKNKRDLQASHLRFQKVAEATKDAIWDWDLKQDLLFLGEGFKESFGLEECLVDMKFPHLIRNIHPKDYPRVIRSFRGVISNPENSKWATEYRFKTKNQTYRFVTNRALIIRDERGDIVRLIGAMTDISKQKEYEQTLKEINRRLQVTVKKLSESNEELEQFAYTASHDLQEPLRMIASFMRLLERRLGDQLDEKSKTYIKFAIDGASRMKRIILDLLEYSRVGRQEYLKEELAFSEIIHEVLLLNKQLIREREAKIAVIGDARLYTNRSLLIQVLHNLVLNAVKYVSADKKPQIEIRVKEKKGQVEVRVKDNGIGIRQEDQERIFIIFQRLHGKNEYTGTGMGLAIVKKAISNLGGKIWLKSTPEEGAKFYFSIPKKPYSQA